MKLLFGMLKKYLDFFLTTEQRENLAYIDYKDITIQIALQEFLYRTSLNENYESSMNFYLSMGGAIAGIRHKLG